MAAAAGIKGIRIEDPAEVDEKLAEALAHPGPVLVDAVVNRMELAMPPKITAEMARASRSTCSRPSSVAVVTRSSSSPDPTCGGDILRRKRR
jgi:hypothetical protein